MLAQYAAQYERLWNDHWWWQARRRLILGKLRGLKAARPLKTALDIGCGNGLFLADLSKMFDARGVEPDERLLTPGGPWETRIDRAEFGPGYPVNRRYDVALMLDTLEHIEDDQGACRQAFRILNDGGYLLITVPALPLLWSAHDEANQHFRRYTRASLGTVLEEAGFVVQELRYFFFWTIAPMLLRRLVSRGGAGACEYDVAIPPKPVNGALYALSRLEQGLFALAGPPAGSSLLAVAVKPAVASDAMVVPALEAA